MAKPHSSQHSDSKDEQISQVRSGCIQKVSFICCTTAYETVRAQFTEPRYIHSRPQRSTLRTELKSNRIGLV